MQIDSIRPGTSKPLRQATVLVALTTVFTVWALATNPLANASVFEDLQTQSVEVDVLGLEISQNKMQVTVRLPADEVRLFAEEETLELCGSDLTTLDMHRSVYLNQQIAALRSANENQRKARVKITGPWNSCLVSVGTVSSKQNN